MHPLNPLINHIVFNKIPIEDVNAKLQISSLITDIFGYAFDKGVELYRSSNKKKVYIYNNNILYYLFQKYIKKKKFTGDMPGTMSLHQNKLRHDLNFDTDDNNEIYDRFQGFKVTITWSTEKDKKSFVRVEYPKNMPVGDYLLNIVNQIKQPNRIVVSSNDHVSLSIYTNIERYIVDKYNHHSMTIYGVDGRYELFLDTTESLIFHDTFKGHKIKLLVSESGNEFDEYIDNDEFRSKSKDLNKKDAKIAVSSKTAEIPILQEYIESIMYSKNIKEGHIHFYNYKQSVRYSQCKWRKKDVVCHKTRDNTIITNHVQKEFFEDYDKFVNNEESYKKRGLPHQRGYLLYGPPGTGKTSLVKVLANIKGIPIFAMEFTHIRDNYELSVAFEQISEFCNSLHIVLFEDIDNSSIFKERKKKKKSKKKLKIEDEGSGDEGEDGDSGANPDEALEESDEDISHDDDCDSDPDIPHIDSSRITLGGLLNIMDGIGNADKRIIIFTMNNTAMVNKYPALFRPGRIDKKIKVDYCNTEQVIKFLHMFYEEDFDESSVNQIEPEDKLSPAVLINIMQDHPENIETVIDMINIKEYVSYAEIDMETLSQ